MDNDDLTPKARHTRQHILDTALDLFARQGFEATTMREIADQAACSIGLAYRYFSRKEELVLALYVEMSAGTIDAIASLRTGRICDRFHRIMEARLASAAPYREALGALLTKGFEPLFETIICYFVTIRRNVLYSKQKTARRNVERIR